MTIDSNSFRQIFEEMDAPAFFHDSQFRLTLANAAYYRESGATEKEALGRHYWEVFPKGTEPLPNCKASSSWQKTSKVWWWLTCMLRMSE